MELNGTYEDYPWELIVSALTGELSPEEDRSLGEWLEVSDNHRNRYAALQTIWEDPLTDYAVYRNSDPNQGLEALRRRIGRSETRLIPMRRWAAAAAVLVLAIGVSWWFVSRNSTVVYETAALERKMVTLPDGSTVFLQPQTHIQLAPGYNKTGRTVTLFSGKAKFNVSHDAQRPFQVDMDGASVKDIGTSFSIEKTADSIKVAVNSGEIAFVAKRSGRSTEMKAGESACLYKDGDLKIKTPVTAAPAPLKFDNAPLATVVEDLEEHFGTRIQLDDPSLAQQRLTVHLDGESLDDAIRTICASLNLNVVLTDGTYILKVK
jgi:transmembrane sensor